MKRSLPLLLIPALTLALHAQSGAHSGQAYGFFGAHATSGDFANLLSVGGGGEGFLYRSLAAGADLAYMFPRGHANAGIGMLTVNPSYHFAGADRTNRFVPFVTGGYALAFRSGTANLFNFGGGATYWFTGRLGFRFEVRNYRTSSADLTTQFRFGMSFR